ncbi:MAG: hypothetical protein AAGK14_13005 [Verrucomicrobiota bacterium]
MKFALSGLLLFLLVSIQTASAAIVINVTEENGNVVFTSEAGSLDVSSLSSAMSGTGGGSFIDPSNGRFGIGGASQDALSDDSFSGPSAFGTGASRSADSTTGGGFGVNGTDGWLTLANDDGGSYGVSTMTFNNATIDSLGLTPGEYTWGWSGDFIRLNIPVSEVIPEPVAASLLLLAGVGGLLRRRARRKATV